jgi:hypothetical protein
VIQSGLHLIPQHPADLIGKWKGTRPKISLTVEVTVTESETRMLGRVIEGPYTVNNSSWPLRITIVAGGGTLFRGGHSRAGQDDLEEIELPDDPLNADNVSTLLGCNKSAPAGAVAKK